jgi:predicted GTPase
VVKQDQQDTAKNRERVLIMGASGRDFHNFNVCFRDDPAYEVVAFTAAQIPAIAGRCYPAELSGAECVRYDIEEMSQPDLATLVGEFLSGHANKLPRH